MHIKVAQKPKRRPTVKFRDVDRDIMAAVSRSTTTSDTLSITDSDEPAVTHDRANMDDSDSDANSDSDSDSEDRIRSGGVLHNRRSEQTL